MHSVARRRKAIRKNCSSRGLLGWQECIRVEAVEARAESKERPGKDRKCKKREMSTYNMKVNSVVSMMQCS